MFHYQKQSMKTDLYHLQNCENYLMYSSHKHGDLQTEVKRWLHVRVLALTG